MGSSDYIWVLTWVAIAASILMGLAGACLFIWAVKKDYFRDIEEAKYHVFWSDLEQTDPPERIGAEHK